MFEQVTRKPVYYVLVLAMLLSIAVSLAALPAVTFAGQKKVTVCHKPGTPAEATLKVAAPALDAHLAHGDYLGPCTEPQSDGCTAVNVFVPDPQTAPNSYYMEIRNLDFYPGEVIHADLTITNGTGMAMEMTAVLNSDGVPIFGNYILLYPGETDTVSIDYTIVEGDDIDGLAVTAMCEEGASFTVDAVNFSCTAAP